MKRIFSLVWKYLTVPFSGLITPSTKNSIQTDHSVLQNHMRLISWNVEGLHDNNLISRTTAICDIIKE